MTILKLLATCFRLVNRFHGWTKFAANHKQTVVWDGHRLIRFCQLFAIFVAMVSMLKFDPCLQIACIVIRIEIIAAKSAAPEHIFFIVAPSRVIGEKSLVA